ncbi:MAG: hypothetical protein QOE45_830 [Frankiaceae bacterium]|jgi:hypothetical protein|nr:hypothetical protein [Frankiaceae bacterium]
MLKKLAAAAFVVSALGMAVPAHAENACLHLHVQVNDVVQDVDQCV